MLRLRSVKQNSYLNVEFLYAKLFECILFFVLVIVIGALADGVLVLITRVGIIASIMLVVIR